ncbi:CPBP family intramembrane glutamic endopeptidase [Synechococcus sp. CS-1328]|uniref:CPBP family intramembrane glutamic endopeptidase n=1 Tax=Synechococcus sp. CS-1328 TaxID=2847976 RepID=UPI00223AC4C1|nr:CPBP family intramembrane glutamic endopeptidase [Synechococcus sp. CS-1328]MCT0225145.1 CPBP family intramembrane metalloprotease [Synechococcus sp. CS-1328]
MAPSSATWKPALAFLSLALSALVWFNGLLDSLQRPSVATALDLRQLELAALAAPAVPAPLQPLLVGADPLEALRKELERLDGDAAGLNAPPQRLQWALLERRRGDDAQARVLLQDLRASAELPPSRRPLLDALLGAPSPSRSVEKPAASATALAPATAPAVVDPALLAALTPDDRIATLLEPWSPSPLLRRLGCEQLSVDAGERPLRCLEAGAARGALWRLVGINLLPALLLLLGLALLVRQLWLSWRGRQAPLPPLQGPTLSGVDVTLLIAGGFVLLGEVLTPLLLGPLLSSAVAALGLDLALGQGLQVFGLYLGLMAAPLTLLAVLLAGLGPMPEGGWLQWRWRPLRLSLGWATSHLVMVLPVVALTGWILQWIWSDPSGSNPLLELVLTSGNSAALLCFAVTAMVLAPLFEETLFRGVLLPVLARRFGDTGAVLGSAALFALAHLSLGELAPLFVLGLGLGWLRLRSGRLGACVLMHGLWNALTFSNLLLLGG